MFASLKNKIREETGNDLSKLTSKITSSTVQRIDSLRGKRSHHGSSSSINSIVSSEGVREDGLLDNEDIRKRITRIESDFARKLEKKEKEWCQILNEKDLRLQALEKDKEEAFKEIKYLKDKLKTAEEFKQKLVEHHEDKEQIENLQTQELSKIKHLVLLREQELSEKTTALKEASAQLDKIRSEVSRLRIQEENLSDLQDDLTSLRHSSARDLASLATKLAESEEERRHLTDLIAVLRQRVSNESDDEHIVTERRLLEQRLEEAHLHLADIKTCWSDKINSLETQVGRLSRQAAEESTERRRAITEKEKLFEKCQQHEAELEFNKLELRNKELKIKCLTQDIEELSNEIRKVKSENEEEVTFLKTQLQNSNSEIRIGKKHLEESGNQLEKSEDEISRLKISVDSEHQANSSLREIITKLEKELSEEKSNSLNVQKTLTRVTSEKNAALIRNAEVSQQMEMVKQEKKRQEADVNELVSKISQLEDESDQHKKKKMVEEQLQNSILELENQLTEKNKNIKTLQLRLADMKKTLQQELRTPGNPNYHSDLIETNSPAILTPSQMSFKNFPNNVRRDDDDVNFKYLKHVVIKFLTSREYEAQHLTKAIATVLKFTPDEERLVQDTLEWKKSWFGSRPKLTQHRSKTLSTS